jgi:hypothetical protein
LAGFAISLGLFLKGLGLGAEFNSASDGIIFRRGHRAKTTTFTPNTSFPRAFSRYSLSGFAIRLGLFLKALGLGAEFNSASNPTTFEQGCNGKLAEILEILGFWTDFEVFAVRIRYTTWLIS